jgi:AcrR family transcriptional regulator
MTEQKKDRIPGAEPAVREASHPSRTRRRGKVLVDAILQAAWDELNEIGYAHLTMEAVAKRAKTNKAAVYRRWPSKARLVTATLQKHLPRPIEKIPDTGSLRGDMLALLHEIVKLMQIVGAETVHGLMTELLGQKLLSALSQVKRSGGFEKWDAAMRQILKNAEARGEVNNVEKISPRVLSLPADLLRYELLTTLEPLSDETVAEIVDDIFLPLVYSSKARNE